jgi:hypothetical protein
MYFRKRMPTVCHLNQAVLYHTDPLQYYKYWRLLIKLETGPDTDLQTSLSLLYMSPIEAIGILGQTVAIM